MSNKDLSRNPHPIDKNTWWYEDKQGISVVIEPPQETKIVNISWRLLRAALKRKDKK
jgi:hypothetical protein